MRDFKPYIISNCISFTLVMLFSCIFSTSEFAPEITAPFILGILGMSTLIATIMYFTDQLNVKAIWFLLIRLVTVYLVVFFGGALIGMFPLTLKSLLLISPIILPVYIGTTGIMMWIETRFAHQINQKIREMRRREKPNE